LKKSRDLELWRFFSIEANRGLTQTLLSFHNLMYLEKKQTLQNSITSNNETITIAVVFCLFVCLFVCLSVVVVLVVVCLW